MTLYIPMGRLLEILFHANTLFLNSQLYIFRDPHGEKTNGDTATLKVVESDP